MGNRRRNQRGPASPCPLNRPELREGVAGGRSGLPPLKLDAQQFNRFDAITERPGKPKTADVHTDRGRYSPDVLEGPRGAVEPDVLTGPVRRVHRTARSGKVKLDNQFMAVTGRPGGPKEDCPG